MIIPKVGQENKCSRCKRGPDLDRLRAELWCNAWIATANANDCKSPEVATRYADAAMEAFDRRFKEEDQEASK